jgi:hypothetical protein
MGTREIPEHLLSVCVARIGIGMEPCRRVDCPDLVRRDAVTGKFFITMSHAGFNSAANNGTGYSTAAGARRASVKLLLGK